MPTWVAATISSRSFLVSLATADLSFARIALNGSLVCQSGCIGASSFTRSSANSSWVYSGCSTQSVPSLSKVAIRSAGGTYFALALSVVALTKPKIAALLGPAFQDGNGSDGAFSCEGAWAMAQHRARIKA